MKIEAVAMVDSGSDFLILSKSIAEILKLELKEDEKGKMIGVGGSIPSYSTKVEVSVEYGYGHIGIVIDAKVIDSDIFPVLLGRQGFFDRFEVTINEKEQYVKIKDMGKY